MKTNICICSLIIFFLFQNIFRSHSQTVITLQPGSEEGIDACITSINPDYNFGNVPNFYSSAWTFGGDFGIQRSLLKFDLTQLSPSTTVIDAKLSLYYWQGSLPGHAGENASYLQKVLENWDEMSVTFNNQPSSTTAGEVSLPASTNQTQDYPDINITQFVSDWIADPQNNFGILFRIADESIYRSMLFASSDNSIASLRPKLVVTYLPCPDPVADFSYIVLGPTVQFYDSSSFADTWYWNFGDGYFSDLRNPVHNYLQLGKYYACLTITDSCGLGQYCDTVVFQPNGVETMNGEKVTIYPIPANDHLNIEWLNPQSGSGEINIINFLGSVIFRKAIIVTSGGYRDEINITELSSGVYYMRIITNKITFLKRFIVSKTF